MMSMFQLNSSHVGSFAQPNQAVVKPRKLSDQLSKVSSSSTTSIVQRNAGRKISATSVISTGARKIGPLRVVNENILPSSRNASFASLPLGIPDNAADSKACLETLSLLKATPPRSIRSLSPCSKAASGPLVPDGTCRESGSNTPKRIIIREEGGESKLALLLSPGGRSADLDESSQSVNQSITSDIQSKADASARDCEAGTNRFKKLLDGLRPQHTRNKGQLTPRKERWSLDDFDDAKVDDIALNKRSRINFHRKASSWSSGGGATPLKLVDVGQGASNASFHPEKASKLRLLLRSSRGSRYSDTTQRASVDGSIDATRIKEELAHQRAIQRRRVLEEFHASEEGYINDLKVLTHVSVQSNTYIYKYGSTSIDISGLSDHPLVRSPVSSLTTA